MTDPEKITLLRLAVIGLLGLVEEHIQDVRDDSDGGESDFILGRHVARAAEAKAALEQTKPTKGTKP